MTTSKLSLNEAVEKIRTKCREVLEVSHGDDPRSAYEELCCGFSPVAARGLLALLASVEKPWAGLPKDAVLDLYYPDLRTAIIQMAEELEEQ